MARTYRTHADTLVEEGVLQSFYSQLSGLAVFVSKLSRDIRYGSGPYLAIDPRNPINYQLAVSAGGIVVGTAEGAPVQRVFDGLAGRIGDKVKAVDANLQSELEKYACTLIDSAR